MRNVRKLLALASCWAVSRPAGCSGLKNGMVALVVCLVGFTACRQDEIMELPSDNAVIAGNTGGVRKGVLQIKLTPEVNSQLPPATRAKRLAVTGNREIDSLLLSLEGVRLERIFPPAGKFEERHRVAGLDRWFRLVYDEDIDPLELQEVCARLEGVEKAGPEYEICLSDNEDIRRDYVGALLDLPMTLADDGLPFNDPRLPMQWHYDQGDLSMAEGAGIGLFKAWRVTTGDPRVVVAVLDMGVDYTHEDLAASMWVNEAELNGLQGVDDDDNGKVDDVYGYDFENDRGTITPGDHGTHVAGTIAAVNNNGTGVCGVAGGSGAGDGVRIMTCSLGSMKENLMNPEDAIVYAADNGALIIQCSWVVKHTQALYDAIDYFVKNAGNELMRGGLAVFAAGNSGVTSKNYPAAYDNTVAVASLNQSNRRSSFSNYGDWIDISAPGGAGATGGSEVYGVLSTTPGNTYGYMSGTSMAAPHVSGVAALIISAKGGPLFTSDDLKDIIYRSVGPLSDKEQNANLMGRGALRADNALWEDDGVAPEAVTDLKVVREKTGFRLAWHIARDANDGQPLEYIVYYRKGSPANGNDVQQMLVSVRGKKAGEEVGCACPDFPENGTWQVAVVGRDTWGNESPLSNEVAIDWQNDHKAPAVITEIKFVEENGQMFLSWVNPVDDGDGTAVMYHLVVRNGQAEDSPVAVDTWINAEGSAGERMKYLCPLAGLDENFVFRIAAVDCWNNNSGLSEGFYYFPVLPDELKAFPNPVQRELHLKWGSSFTGVKVARVYDTVGRLVLECEVAAGDGAGQGVVDFSTLAAGRYILKFCSAGKTKSRNIIKVK